MPNFKQAKLCGGVTLILNLHAKEFVNVCQKDHLFHIYKIPVRNGVYATQQKPHCKYDHDLIQLELEAACIPQWRVCRIHKIKIKQGGWISGVVRGYKSQDT